MSANLVQRARPLLDLIIAHESAGAVASQRAASAYDVIYGGIKRADYPPAPLTQLTIRRVLAWQDGIDAKYQSEAAGAYQIMEDTLRDLVSRGAAKDTELFDANTQDRLAVVLLEGAGLSRFLAGSKRAASFGDGVARVWAAFPVHSDQQGWKRPVKWGESYYASVAGNRALVAPEAVIAALGAVLAAPAPSPEPAAIAALEARMEAMERKFSAVVAALT